MALASPWSHIVRGGESEAVPSSTTSLSSPSPSSSPSIPAPESSNRSPRKSEAAAPEAAAAGGGADAGSSGPGNAGRGKKPAWSIPSNGVVEAGPVMGAVSWPALSESARASPRSSSDSLKTLAEGSASQSQAPAIASPSQKPITNNVNPNLSPNQSIPVRQKSFKRGGASTSNGAVAQPPPPADLPQHTSDTAAAAVPESSPGDLSNNNSNNTNNNNNGKSGSKEPLVPPFHVGNHHMRSSFRRGSGSGPYHNNYGNRRDHDRQNHEWNFHRNYGRMQHPRFMPRNYQRPPPVSHAFVGPSPVRPYGNPVGYNDFTPYMFFPSAPPPPEPYRGGVPPYIAPVNVIPQLMYYPGQDHQLHSKLVRQIDYYFSYENLCKDLYLRQKMDEQGWVPISEVAKFNRVKDLTKDIPFILAALQASSVVEVDGDKIRRRNDWMNWLLPTSQIPVLSNRGSSNADGLAAGMQSLRLEGSTGESRNN